MICRASKEMDDRHYVSCPVHSRHITFAHFSSLQPPPTLVDRLLSAVGLSKSASGHTDSWIDTQSRKHCMATVRSDGYVLSPIQCTSEPAIWDNPQCTATASVSLGYLRGCANSTWYDSIG